VKLLLAEDDEFSRDMMVRRLERQGYEMIAAADGREALLAARQHRPDLIIMDLDMPILDGRGAIRALKSDPHTFKIPVIVLTAHSGPNDVAEAVANGVAGYEMKPIVLRRLVERIQEVLGPLPAAPAPAPAPASALAPEPAPAAAPTPSPAAE
jgi:two-component system response regulator